MHFLPEYGAFGTPLKSYSISPHTLLRTSIIRRTAPRRGAISDHVDCVGMSARKKFWRVVEGLPFSAIFGQKVGYEERSYVWRVFKTDRYPSRISEVQLRRKRDRDHTPASHSCSETHNHHNIVMDVDMAEPGRGLLPNLSSQQKNTR